MVRSITSDSIVGPGCNDVMCSRDEEGRELWTRDACTDELGAMRDNLEDEMKGEGGNALFGTVCCANRDEWNNEKKGKTYQNGGVMEMMYIVRGS